MSDAPKTLLCFGYGYSARYFAKALDSKNWRIVGTTRSADKAARLEKEGVSALLDHDIDAVAAAAQEADAILISSGPDEQGDPTLNRHGPAMRDAIAGEQLRWLGYLSTTGVYGDHGGAWIDETAPREPATERGRLRLAAEDAWMALGGPLHIFRLAGIYGPGRGPFSKLKKGVARRIVKDGQVFSRIHVEDIAQILEASLNRPRPGAAYNGCDDEPAPPQDVIAYAADLLNMPAPPETPFAEAVKTMTPMAASFYAESKRVSNRLIKDELGVQLKYPDYRSGLKALLEAESR